MAARGERDESLGRGGDRHGEDLGDRDSISLIWMKETGWVKVTGGDSSPCAAGVPGRRTELVMTRYVARASVVSRDRIEDDLCAPTSLLPELFANRSGSMLEIELSCHAPPPASVVCFVRSEVLRAIFAV